MSAIYLLIFVGACTSDEPDPDDVGHDAGHDVEVDAEVGDTADVDAEHPLVDVDTGPSGGERLPFAVECAEPVDGVVSFDFDVDSSADAYTVVPFAFDEKSAIEPQSITTPDGMEIDFQGENFFQIYGLDYPGLQWGTAITVPAAPNFESQLESGSHELVIDSGAEEICYYFVEAEGTPTVLDLNIYLVGLEDIDLTASTAQDHEDFQSILTTVDEIFDQADLSLGEIRYMELEDAVVERYRTIYEEEEIYALVAQSEYPGSDVESALSANVFITERFVFPAIGLAMGIPGPPGYHQSLLSGIALTGEYIGDDEEGNIFTAIAIAHEIGHFLGLFHTSEVNGLIHDPLDDTPECRDFQPPWNCPGFDNLMFPMVNEGSRELTPDQSFVMHANPLTR